MNTVFGKQECATTRALTWFIMHSLERVQNSNIGSPSNQRIPTQKLTNTCKDLLEWQFARFLYKVNSKVNNGNCIDVISKTKDRKKAYMRSLHGGRNGGKGLKKNSKRKNNLH